MAASERARSNACWSAQVSEGQNTVTERNRYDKEIDLPKETDNRKRILIEKPVFCRSEGTTSQVREREY